MLRPPLVMFRSRTVLAQNGAWTTGFDQATGATYYYNEQTGQSQWEPPYQASTAQQQSYGAGLPGVTALWRIAGFSGVTGFDFVVNGRVIPVENAPFTKDSFYKGTVHQTSTVLPYTLLNGDEVVLGRWNMLEQRLTVSRMQCAVKAMDDGTALLISCGRGPTLLRGYSSGGQWVPLMAGQNAALSDGDQISLDCSDPETFVFTCHDGSATLLQGGAYPQQHGHEQGFY